MKMTDTLKKGPAAQNDAAGKTSTQEAADLMSVSRRSVTYAVKRKKDNLEAHEAVKAGLEPPKVSKPKVAFTPPVAKLGNVAAECHRSGDREHEKGGYPQERPRCLK